MTINIFLIFFSAGTVKKDSHQSKFYCSSENEYNFNLKSESKNEDCRFVVVSPSFTFKVLPYINLDCDRSIFII